MAKPDDEDEIINPLELAYRFATDIYGSDNVDHESFMRLMATMDSTEPIPEMDLKCAKCGTELRNARWLPIESFGQLYCSTACATIEYSADDQKGPA